jgi:hypothetical protein
MKCLSVFLRSMIIRGENPKWSPTWSNCSERHSVPKNVLHSHINGTPAVESSRCRARPSPRGSVRQAGQACRHRSGHASGRWFWICGPPTEEEENARIVADSVNVLDPFRLHLTRPIATFPPTMAESIPWRYRTGRHLPAAVIHRNRTAAGALRRSAIRGSPYFLSSTLTPHQMWR